MIGYTLKTVYVPKRSVADLHREWARILDMCEGSMAWPPDFVRCNGSSEYPLGQQPPNFIYGEPDDYEFAIARIGYEPVFVGDELIHTPCREYSQAPAEVIKVVAVSPMLHGQFLDDIRGMPYGISQLSIKGK